MIPFTSNLVDVVYFSKSQTQGITNHANISGKQTKIICPKQNKAKGNKKNINTKFKTFEA